MSSVMSATNDGTTECINCTCPACARVLASVPLGPDRHVTCPECGHIFVIHPPKTPANTIKSLSIAAINAACPNCGLVISNAVISASNTVQCQACKGIFFVRIRQRVSQVKMHPARPASAASPRPSGESSRAKLETAGAPPSAFTAELDPADVPTGDYSAAQIEAIAYDRPERVPLGPRPAEREYQPLRWTGWAIIAATALAMTTRMVWGFTPPAAVPAALAWTAAGLDTAAAVLVAAALSFFFAQLPRLDGRANWIAWRSASITEPLYEPLGSSIHLLAPWTATGVLLLASGVLLAIRTFGTGLDQSNTCGIITMGALVLLLVPACSELRHFFSRMAQLGKALSQRKRGDEVGLPPPARVQGFEQTSSALLALMAAAFLAAGFAVYVWHCFQPVQTLLGTVLIVLGFAGILGGGYTLHRLASFWSEALYGWEYGARSIGRTHPPYNGRTATRAFNAAAVTLSIAIVALVIPVMKTVGNSSVSGMLLSIFVPTAIILFVLWLAALKKDSFRFVMATTVVAGARAFEVIPNRRTAWLVRILVGVAVLQTCAWFMCAAFVLNQLWQGPLHAGASGAAITIMSTVTRQSLFAMAATWAGLTLLDIDRAAGNLDVCREVEIEMPSTD